MNKETNSQVFLYNQKPVIIQLESDGMVNSTKLAKNFGKQKRPQLWLRTKAAQEYISAYSDDAQICASSLTATIVGRGRNQGTYMHPDIAIEYARWLNPRFGIWCNLRIQELLKNGYTVSDEFKLEMNEKLQTLCLAMEAMKLNYNALVERNEELEAMVLMYRNRTRCIDVQTHARTYTVTEIARELDLQPEELNEYLRRNWVQHKIDGFWELKPEYQGQGYAVTKYGENDYFEIDGSHHKVPYHYLVWTPKGREMILEMYELYE